MKNQIKTLAAVSALALATNSYASVAVNNVTVGASTDFPTFSISGLNGARSFSDVLASPAGATIAGGQAQGAVAVGTAIGEVFKWGGSANGDLLTAFSMIALGEGGAATYQPFLFDLGTLTFNANASTFNPSLFTDLLSAVTVQPPALGSGNFLEFDLNGADQITLTVGHSYAFGLLNNNGTSDMTFLRDSGTQADPNGAPFQILAGGLAGTSATVPGFGGGPRNLMFALYTTTPVPEPASMTLVGLGTLAGLMFIRRRKV